MKVLVLGGGVIGVCCAYELARSGHEVMLLERQPSAALETSYANAGEISPGYAAPWAGPGVPLKAIQWLLMRHRPLVLWPLLDPAMWRWAVMMLANCTERAYAVNKSRMVPIAEYSRDRMKALRLATGIAYDERALGTLQLFRTQKQLDATAKDIAVLKQYGVPYELFDGDGFLKAEPALALTKHKFVGALRLPGDETGDCFKFTTRLARMAEALGVQTRFGVTIQSIAAAGGEVTGVQTEQHGFFKADRYVVALGSHSPRLLAPLGIRLPVYPVKGYSITVPIVDQSAAPRSTIMDETHKVAVTRLGDRIRVGGTAELAGYSVALRQARRRTLEHVVTDLFPKAGDVVQSTFWCGLRPMTPDGTPVIGPTPLSNLLLATGHGTLGWTMAAGTGRVIADLVSGREPEISLNGLTMARYPKAWRG
jgi:D-amino-acid dehydrogenase